VLVRRRRRLSGEAESEPECAAAQAWREKTTPDPRRATQPHHGLPGSSANDSRTTCARPGGTRRGRFDRLAGTGNLPSPVTDGPSTFTSTRRQIAEPRARSESGG
jgi:hypothetical protein